jgi:hypothetical protein
MRETVRNSVSQLDDTGGGWVFRRDAAEALGRGAAEAVEALKAHQDDPDQDVRRTVRTALLHVREAFRGAESDVPAGRTPLERMVRALESPGKRDWVDAPTGFALKVSLPSGRSQTVRVEPAQSQGNEDTVIVWTPCAAANPKAYEWALKNNNHFALCAVTLRDHEGAETLCMLGSFLAEELTPSELKAAVKEVAFYGDWLEERLSKGEDTY